MPKKKRRRDLTFEGAQLELAYGSSLFLAALHIAQVTGKFRTVGPSELPVSHGNTLHQHWRTAMFGVDFHTLLPERLPWRLSHSEINNDGIVLMRKLNAPERGAGTILRDCQKPWRSVEQSQRMVLRPEVASPGSQFWYCNLQRTNASKTRGFPTSARFAATGRNFEIL